MSEIGLRARKTARTREEIARAAKRVFAKRGYDTATLEDIAAEAEVHKRTLLRYFPTKTHLALHGHFAALDAFCAAVQQREQTPILDVWEAHVVANSRDMMRRGRLANTRKIAADATELRQALLEIQSRYQRIIAVELARDLGRSPASDILTRVAAAALVGGNFAVGAMVMQSEAYAELARCELEVIRIVREGLLRRTKKTVTG